MGIYKLTDAGSFATARTNYKSMLAGNTAYALGDYYSIASATGGGAGSVTFSSIPSTYTHLELRARLKTSGSANGLDNINLRINSDTGSNYGYHNILAINNGVSSERSTGETSAYFAKSITAGGTANDYGAFILRIPNYRNTNFVKTFNTFVNAGYNTNDGCAMLFDGYWNSTSAITSITLLANISVPGLVFTSDSQFALYGIAGV